MHSRGRRGRYLDHADAHTIIDRRLPPRCSSSRMQANSAGGAPAEATARQHARERPTPSRAHDCRNARHRRRAPPGSRSPPASRFRGRCRRPQGGGCRRAQGQGVAGRGPAEDDQRSGRPQAGRMGDPAQRRDRERRSQPLHGLHQRKSDLAGRRHVAPPRRGDAVDGPARSGFVRAFFGKDRPITTKGKFALARALLLQGDRAGAQSLVREAWRNDDFSGELEGLALDVFRDLITAADHKARMDMRLYAEDADDALRSANRAGGNAPAIAKARIAVIKKAANAKAMLDAVPAEAHARRRLHLQPRPVSAPRRQGGRGGRADPVGAAAITDRRSTPTSGGSSGGWSPASCSISARSRPPIASRATPPCRPRTTTAPSTSSPPAGSRCASSTIPRPRSAISPRSPTATATRSRSRAPAIGRDARRKRSAEATRRARITRRRRAIPPPITARSRVRGSATRTSSCVPPPEPAAGPARSLEVVRAIELLYAIDERDLIAGALADLGERADGCGGAGGDRRGRRPPQGCARHAAARQGGARARASARALCLSDRRHSRISRHRAGDRARRGLCHRAPGEHLQSEDHLERQSHGADAGDAGRRPLRGEEIRRSPTTRNDC